MIETATHRHTIEAAHTRLRRNAEEQLDPHVALIRVELEWRAREKALPVDIPRTLAAENFLRLGESQPLRGQEDELGAACSM